MTSRMALFAVKCSLLADFVQGNAWRMTTHVLAITARTRGRYDTVTEPGVGKRSFRSVRVANPNGDRANESTVRVAIACEHIYDPYNSHPKGAVW